MKKIRLAVIGTGMAWERLHYPAICELGDKYEIVALCNRTKKDAEEFAKKINLGLDRVYDDYNEMLKRDDIDAVDILVPIESNYLVSEAVAKTGRDFICEKPLASNREDAKKYLELSKKYNVKIMIAENYRYSDENNKIRDIVNSGKIGDVIYFIKNNISCFPCEMTKDTFAATEWRQHPKFFGGAFLDAAIHDIAAMRHIFGAVECVQAFGKPQSESFNPYVSVNTNILFKNGVIGYYTYYPSGVETQKPAVGFRIFGTKGEIYLEDKTCGIINVSYRDGSSEHVNFIPERGFYNELLNYYNAVNGTEQISVTPEMEYGDVKMVFDILDSISFREIIYVDEETPKRQLEFIDDEVKIHPFLQ
ncbi:MAG TPA: Gfo/Idh/MocA family oxidoreductase [Acetivibrio sp.]|uniref:Gfo/Idh/MocA family protein n=1 Tax=Acetivibrio sp. TaxID=1872092 RepID=UPI002CF25C01|nr:Gfo/Idh/MocA family oxidoreductase [Acetivibrio sp.]HOM02244.1 Gfo/Idh/MocA family oxidoreductase [Acetivibrio sp.]